MARFCFETLWEVNAPLPAVWELIQNSTDWPKWWRGVCKVEERAPGDLNGVGKRQFFEWRSRLPYPVRFEMRVAHVDIHSRIEGIASGEVEGTGTWRFSMHGNHTILRYTWEIRTNLWWVNIIAPFTRWLIRWNHDKIMNWGAVGLAQRLAAPLIRIENKAC